MPVTKTSAEIWRKDYERLGEMLEHMQKVYVQSRRDAGASDDMAVENVLGALAALRFLNASLEVQFEQLLGIKNYRDEIGEISLSSGYPLVSSNQQPKD